MPDAAVTSASAAPPAAESYTPGAALAFRDYRLLWSGALASNLGNWMQTVAQAQLVYAISGSTVTLGVVAFATQIPMVAMTLLGGLLADRLERRRMLQVTQSVLTCSALTLTLLTLTGKIEIWQIVILAIIQGSMAGINIPTFQAFIGDLVPREVRGAAIALNSAQFHTSRSLGPALVALIFMWVAEEPGRWQATGLCFALNTLTFGALLTALALIRFRPDHIEALTWRPGIELRRLGGQLGEVLRYVRTSAPVTILLILTGLAAFFGMPLIALLPAYSADVVIPFHHNAVPAQVQGHLLTAAGAGSVVGALWGAGFLQRRGPQLGIVISMVGYGTSLLAIALTRQEGIALFWMAWNGFFATASAVQVNTRLQVRAPDLLRGRVMAVYSMVFTLAMALGNLVSGVVAHGGRVPLALGLNGVLFAVLAGLVAWHGWRRWTRE